MSCMKNKPRSVSVRLFASLQSVLNKKIIDVRLKTGSKVMDLRSLIAEQEPSLKELLPHCIITINRQFAQDEDRIPENALIAVFPPVSGGSTFPEITSITGRPLHPDRIFKKMTQNTTGALACFVGVVREKSGAGSKRITKSIEYQAYKDMAIEKMQRIIHEIRRKWPRVEGIAIVQRIGKLKAGTISVCIACSASHRESGVFPASRYAIDRLKQIVPIWKKEIGSDGECWVEGDYIPRKGD
jgi:molybdopterin synthase catalytic subunit/molybdopterin converting factor small subunit